MDDPTIASTVEQRDKLTAAYSSVATAGSGTLSSLYFAPAFLVVSAAFLLFGAMVTISTRLGWNRYQSLCVFGRDG